MQSYAGPQPRRINPSVWPLPRSLATTCGISVDVSSSPYLDVSVQAVPHVHLWIQCTFRGSSPRGFPHSEISGSMDICSSPKLIAACRVLHRLLMPRHSPCALSSLTLSPRTHVPPAPLRVKPASAGLLLGLDPSGFHVPAPTLSEKFWFSFLNYAGYHKEVFFSKL